MPRASDTVEVGRGRPPASSRAVLEEAAYELFLEQGYAGTTVAQIARRAGVSRGTFFNYFPAKADVFWGDVDAAIAELRRRLRTIDADAPMPDAAMTVVAEIAAEFGADRVPWILTQFEAAGSPAEVRSSAAERFLTVTRLLEEALAEGGRQHSRRLAARTAAHALLGCVIAAAQEWADAGVSRAPLSVYLARAYAALRGAFR